ncbi:unnamed protein product [Owenia fusiformis]|uniref:von Willebrand factor A domain-containing protein 8 n=1 Tax=Owenia fusiformis TaxID=6347 RepID=A0A8J1UAL0_OWEFU|nr:unnamed protein product [Owenia fusiformis]
MLNLYRMQAERALRRVQNLRNILSSNHHVGLRPVSSDSKVSIGDVTVTVKTPKNVELVPTKYLTDPLPQSIARHLRWIMQKDLLGQDVYLIGAPGPLRRTIAMMYLELTKREAEYVSLSRDTTESDLKQRREIKSGTAFYIDQCAVRAAVEGRILILEGIEKAERNVLPVLNNLLENREMQLDDGRFLMAADRYDKLLKDHEKSELDAWKLVRVNKDFRVIALGLPVPRYRGNPLDPPLRSRFQARDITSLPFKDQIDVLNAVGPRVPSERLSQMLSFATTMLSEESHSMGLPDFPIDNLRAVMAILDAMPTTSCQNLLSRLYPHDVMLGKEGKTAVHDMIKKFELDDPTRHQYNSSVNEVRASGSVCDISANVNGGNYHFEVPGGGLHISSQSSGFVRTKHHDQLLADIMQSHMVSDFCIVGTRGCGKTVLIKQFADMLGYHIEPIMLYQDMTSRDLLQQRTTLPNGDTTWRPSPLVTAALEGSLAVLDGVHRVNPGTFAVLHRLIHDRELSLFDGSRLLRRDRYDALKESTGFTDKELYEKGILPIHPSFRIIALAEPPVLTSSTQQWMTPEVLTMFLYHHMRPMQRNEENEVLHKIVPDAVNLSPILELTNKLRASHDTTVQSIASSLSTRQLVRIAHRLAKYPESNFYDIIHKACLSRFLPRMAKQSLDQVMEDVGITKVTETRTVDNLEKSITCEIKEGILRIGTTEVAVHNPETKMKVPDVLFYENAQHLSVMEDMLKDYLLGEHLLLVGNQGVGKNKIIDRFLYLLNRPREYLQLHRDTTVQTLTLQPTVQDGVIVYEDSPLVRAVKLGHILVIDEADKAPTNVTCILKTLVESGEMHLADGRRIVSAHSGIPSSEKVIVAHPDFRMFILANRPGFPFLGNDFFGAMGDIFSAHAVDNPNIDSEMAMLRQYGPDVEEHILRKLVLAIGELRDMADQGLISYPYSTREVVNMVKHLQKFPNEGLSNVVRNVFDFDSYNEELQETIVKTLQKHGIPIGAKPTNVELAKEFPLPAFQLSGQWNIARQGGRTKTGLIHCPSESKTLRIKGPVRVATQTFPLERSEARSEHFTEQEAYWTIPLDDTNIIADVAVCQAKYRHASQTDDIIHVVTCNPIGLYTMTPNSRFISHIDLYDVFPMGLGVHRSLKPKVKLATLGASLNDCVILHEESSNVTLIINTETGDVTRLLMSSYLEEAAGKITRTFLNKATETWKMCSEFSHEGDGMVVFHQENGQTIDVLNVLEGTSCSITVPIKIQSMHLVDRDTWLLTQSDENMKYVLRRKGSDYVLQPITEEQSNLDDPLIGRYIELAGSSPLEKTILSRALGQSLDSPNRVMVTRETYASIALGFPDLDTDLDIYTLPREELPQVNKNISKDQFAAILNRPPSANAKSGIVYLPDSGMVIRALPTWKVPTKVFPGGAKPQGLTGYLEITDLANHKLRYIPVPGARHQSPYTNWMSSNSDVSLVMANLSNDNVVTVDAGGCVRLWETVLVHLEKSMQQWRNMIGQDDGRPLQITHERPPSDKELGGPKHGKTDPTGAPHVGGNTWAGGTGGRDTAGLGGVGGPYRLDGGGDVHQVSQVEKDAVPEHIRRAAREMAEKAWKQRLREIKMSEYDGELYEVYSKSVRKQVTSLRVILESLQAKGKERQWLKHQQHGDLDDAKLIEGITGEKSIYRRRGEQDPEMGTPQQKPKLLKLVVDVSGSMYRFDGHDKRLERSMEACLMVMEAFENYEQKFKYEISGHSGEGPNFEFVKGKVPSNNKERLDTLKMMIAHSQFCLSGDHTLEATKKAVEDIAKEEEADERFVIVLSDANLDRYGIRPQRFADVLKSNDDVNAFAIFIGSLGNQAQVLTKQLPQGKGFVCLDTKDIPQILQQIFTSTMLSTR